MACRSVEKQLLNLYNHAKLSIKKYCFEKLTPNTIIKIIKKIQVIFKASNNILSKMSRL